MDRQTDTQEKLKVFISYSRNDLAFVDQLAIALESRGFELMIDRHEITGGESWAERLRSLIQSADSLVFVLSPDSVQSRICEWELAEAERLGKRIIPVVCHELGSAPVPAVLQAFNYIYFYPNPNTPGSGFGQGLVHLEQALETDPAWIKEHTRLTGLAIAWDERGRNSALLLREADLQAAKHWLASWPKNAPQPTDLQHAFIAASDESEAALAAKEKLRLAEARAEPASSREDLTAWEARLRAQATALEDWAKALEEKEAALKAAEASVMRPFSQSRPAPKPRGTKIFISYRRAQSLHVSGRIFDRLEKEFTRGEVFFDVDAIPVGINFKDHIRGSLERSAVLLAVIGRDWCNGAWLQNGLQRWWSPPPEDHVQSEIELAFEFGVPVTPILIDQTPMPGRGIIPTSISQLCDLNAASVRGGRDFHADMDMVCVKIRELRSQVENAA